MSGTLLKFVKDKSVSSSPLKLIQWDQYGDIKYVPNVAGDWVVPPTGALEALDELAQRVNSITSGAGLSAFTLHGTASDIATYYSMDSNIQAGTLVNISNLAVTDGQVLASFATPVGSPNVNLIPAGFFKAIVHLHKTAGTKDIQAYAEFYKRAVGGAETLLFTTGNTGLVGGIDAEYSVDALASTVTAILPSDRIVVKIVALVTGPGSAPDIDINIEGSTASRIEYPSFSVPNVAASYALETKSANFNAIGNRVYIVTALATATLPVPVLNTQLIIKKFGLASVTVAQNGSENIDGVAASFVMASSKQSATFIADGTDWFII